MSAQTSLSLLVARTAHKHSLQDISGIIRGQQHFESPPDATEMKKSG